MGAQKRISEEERRRRRIDEKGGKRKERQATSKLKEASAKNEMDINSQIRKGLTRQNREQ